MKSFGLAAVALTALLLSAGGAVAQPCGGPGGPGRGFGSGGPGFGPGGPGFGSGGPGFGPMLPLLLKSADLSDSQKASVRDILDEHHERIDTLRDQLREEHEALAQALFADPAPSRSALDTKTQRINELRAAMMSEGIDVALQVSEILTPEQRAKARTAKQRLEGLRSEMHDLFGEGRGSCPNAR